MLANETQELITLNSLTLTEQQTEAVIKLKEWWYQVNEYSREDLSTEEKFTAIYGVPGSGKSTSIWAFIRWLQKEQWNINIILCAPTHKAKQVLIEMAAKNNIVVKITTIYSALGFESDIDDNTGEHAFIVNNRRRFDIGAYDLVIYDECSMTKASLWEYIKTLYNFPPCICMGDREQLRPVKDLEKSPIFDEVTNSYTLTQAMRYKGKIGELVSAIKASSFFVNPLKYIGEDIEVLEKSDWLDSLADAISSQEAQDNPNHVRALAFTNKNVNWLNNIMQDESYRRKKGLSVSRDFFPFLVQKGDIKTATKLLGWENDEPPQYERGMYLICNKPVTEWNARKRKRISVINNGTTVQIIDATTDTVEGYKAWRLLVEWDDTDDYGDKIHRAYNLCCIDEDYKSDLEKQLEAMRQKAIVQTNPAIKKTMWRDRASLRDSFADMSQIYAMTIHKSQGSTIDIVYLDLSDLLQCREQQVFKELYYTACSRASQKLVIAM